MIQKFFIAGLLLAMLSCAANEPAFIPRETFEKAEALHNEAAAAFNEGRPLEAEDLWSEAIALDPENSDYRINRAVSRLAQGRDQAALRDLEDAIKLQEKLDIVYDYIGVIYMRANNYNKATTAFKKALRANRNYAPAYYNLAVSYFTVGLFNDALFYYDRAIELNDRNAGYYYNRGRLYERTGRYRNAVDDYNRAIRLDGGMTEAYYNLGISYAHLKEYDLAIEAFSKALSVDGNHYASLYNRAFIYFHHKNDPGAAYNDIRRALALAPDNQSVKSLSEEIDLYRR
jgi:tetratricopeptide (TPR) repeat protein